MAVWVKDLTGSNGAAGLTSFFLAAPALLAPVAGVYVDRVKRRTLLIWGNVASALAVAPLLLVDGAGDVWIIYTVAVIYGASFVVLPAALNGLLKQMLPDGMLVDANATLSTSREALRLVGPLPGAGLFTVIGGGWVAIIDGASFVAASIAIAFLPVGEPPPLRVEGHWRGEFLAGIRYIRKDGVLTHTLVAVGVSLLVIGFMESAIFAMVDAFDKPASYVGVVVSVQGVGAALGGLTSALVIRVLGESTSVGGSLVTFGVGLAICAATRWLPGVFAGVVVLGYALPIFIVALNTMLQRHTPQRLMGRVSAATDVVLGTPQACSIAFGALLVSLISYRAIYWICAAVILASATYLMVALRGMNGVRPTPESSGERPTPVVPGDAPGSDTVVGAGV